MSYSELTKFLFTYTVTNIDSLFRPFMKLDLSAIGLYPHEICNYCATEISSLMNALRGMYGLRRMTLSVTVILMSAATVHLLNLPSQSATMHLTQALQDLHTMSVNHRYASSCLEMIHRLASQWGIPLPESAKTMSPFQSSEPMHHTAPQMSVFFTQATLSNDSIDNLSVGGQARHDSGSMYEPSFVQHSYTVLPQHGSTLSPPELNMHSMRSNSQSSQGYASSSVHSTPVIGTQSMWPQFQAQQMLPPGMHGTDYPVMTDQSAYSYNPYAQPPS